MITKEKVLELMAKHKACKESTDWVSNSDLSLEEMWNTCQRGDWLIWIGWKLLGMKNKEWEKIAAKTYIKPGMSYAQRADIVRSLISWDELNQLVR